MNISYISGFFDADGSITMCRQRAKDPYKTLKIDFTNTKLEILLEIQKYLSEEHGLTLSITTKPPRKENHSVSYVLSTAANRVCYSLCKLLQSEHPMKRHRINTVLKYHDSVVIRNGKYNERQKQRRLAYERLFFFNS